MRSELERKRLLHRKFLQSEEWKSFRMKILFTRGSICERCGKPGTDVHHKTYVRWGGKELPEDVEILCRKCHDKEHSGRPKDSRSVSRDATIKRRDGKKYGTRVLKRYPVDEWRKMCRLKKMDYNWFRSGILDGNKRLIRIGLEYMEGSGIRKIPRSDREI